VLAARSVAAPAVHRGCTSFSGLDNRGLLVENGLLYVPRNHSRAGSGGVSSQQPANGRAYRSGKEVQQTGFENSRSIG